MQKIDGGIWTRSASGFDGVDMGPDAKETGKSLGWKRELLWWMRRRLLVVRQSLAELELPTAAALL
jgi:hypothetical protein